MKDKTSMTITVTTVIALSQRDGEFVRVLRVPKRKPLRKPMDSREFNRTFALNVLRRAVRSGEPESRIQQRVDYCRKHGVPAVQIHAVLNGRPKAEAKRIATAMRNNVPADVKRRVFDKRYLLAQLSAAQQKCDRRRVQRLRAAAANRGCSQAEIFAALARGNDWRRRVEAMTSGKA